MGFFSLIPESAGLIVITVILKPVNVWTEINHVWDRKQLTLGAETGKRLGLKLEPEIQGGHGNNQRKLMTAQNEKNNGWGWGGDGGGGRHLRAPRWA